MRKRLALLAMVGAVLVFTLALIAFSVYTVNAAVASSTISAPVDPVPAANAAATASGPVVTDISSDDTGSVELSVQHIGTECHGDSADVPAY